MVVVLTEDEARELCEAIECILESSEDDRMHVDSIIDYFELPEGVHERVRDRFERDLREVGGRVPDAGALELACDEAWACWLALREWAELLGDQLGCYGPNLPDYEGTLKSESTSWDLCERIDDPST